MASRFLDFLRDLQVLVMKPHPDLASVELKVEEELLRQRKCTAGPGLVGTFGVRGVRGVQGGVCGVRGGRRETCPQQGVPTAGQPARARSQGQPPRARATSQGQIPRALMGRGRSQALEHLMKPAFLRSPLGQADPPPPCLLRALECQSVDSPVTRRAYWGFVLRGLSPEDNQLVDAWLFRVKGHEVEAVARQRSRSREPLPGPPGQPRRPSAVRFQESVESLERPRRPSAARFQKSVESLEPSASLLLVSKPRDEEGMDVDNTWYVECQPLWVEMDEVVEGHLGCHPAALAEVARGGALKPVLEVVQQALAGTGTPSMGCLEFECDDGRGASVAVACLVSGLLRALGHAHQVMHLGLVHDDHQVSCAACRSLVPEDAAEAVLSLWESLEPSQP